MCIIILQLVCFSDTRTEQKIVRLVIKNIEEITTTTTTSLATIGL